MSQGNMMCSEEKEKYFHLRTEMPRRPPHCIPRCTDGDQRQRHI